MPIFNEDTRIQLTDLVGELPNKVNVIVFNSDSNCRTCRDTLQYITEFTELNENMELSVFDFDNNKAQVEKYNVEHVPAIVILDKDMKDRGVKYYGIPAGYEIHSLIASVKEASGIEDNISPEHQKRIDSIDKPVKIKVFVTPTCPHCPVAVINGHKLAFKNKNIVCEMIESTSFAALSQKYGVRGVPKIIINETHELTGSQPVEKFLEIIEKL